jgi:hypothetical protein
MVMDPPLTAGPIASPVALAKAGQALVERRLDGRAAGPAMRVLGRAAPPRFQRFPEARKIKVQGRDHDPEIRFSETALAIEIRRYR